MTTSDKRWADDPQMWWEEHQRQLQQQQGGWQSLPRLHSTAPVTDIAEHTPPPAGGSVFRSLIKGFLIRLGIAAALFAFIGAWSMFKLPGSDAVQRWTFQAVTQEMDFQAIEAWYGSMFGGTPAFFPFDRQAPDTQEVSALLEPLDWVPPVSGVLAQPYQSSEGGVKVIAKRGSDVVAIAAGRVLQIEQNRNGQYTVVVEHANHLLSIYGQLDFATAKADDWVNKGQAVGGLEAGERAGEQSTVYFAIQQNGQPLDPTDVIAVD